MPVTRASGGRRTRIHVRSISPVRLLQAVERSPSTRFEGTSDSFATTLETVTRASSAAGAAGASRLHAAANTRASARRRACGRGLIGAWTVEEVAGRVQGRAP